MMRFSIITGTILGLLSLSSISSTWAVDSFFEGYGVTVRFGSIEDRITFQGRNINAKLSETEAALGQGIQRLRFPLAVHFPETLFFNDYFFGGFLADYEKFTFRMTDADATGYLRDSEKQALCPDPDLCPLSIRLTLERIQFGYLVGAFYSPSSSGGPHRFPKFGLGPVYGLLNFDIDLLICEDQVSGDFQKDGSCAGPGSKIGSARGSSSDFFFLQYHFVPYQYAGDTWQFGFLEIDRFSTDALPIRITNHRALKLSLDQTIVTFVSITYIF